MICTVCGNEVEKLLSAVVDGRYISERCEKDLAHATASADYSNKYRRDRDREDHRRDILQVGDEGFIKEYPDAARQKGYSEDQMRKYG